MPASNEDYGTGCGEAFGDTVTCHEFCGLDPRDLPQPGDFVRLKTSAHLLLKVTPSRTKAHTVSYVALIVPLDTIKPGDKVLGSESSLELFGE